MTETGYFLTGLAVCVIVVLGIITIIHRRLSAMLGDLCEGEQRARFWSSAIEIWFALFSISAAFRWYPEGTLERQLFRAGITQVKNGLDSAANAIILFSLGLAFFIIIRKFREYINNIARRKSA